MSKIIQSSQHTIYLSSFIIFMGNCSFKCNKKKGPEFIKAHPIRAIT